MITIKPTREQATEIFLALNSAEAGFAPGNAVSAADNLNTLHAAVTGLDKGKNAFRREVKKLGKDVKAKLLSAEDFEAKVEKLSDELTARGEEEVELSLHPVKLTDQEIAESKLRPGALAVIRRWLSEPVK